MGDHPNCSQKLSYFWQAMHKEAMVWSHLHHPNVLPFCGVDQATFKDGPCLVSPWMPEGNLIDFLMAKELDEAEIINLVRVSQGLSNDDLLIHCMGSDQLRGVLLGLTYLHGENIVHGDLHPVGHSNPTYSCS